MCLNENPSQSSNIVRPPIWVFTSWEVNYYYGGHHQLRGSTLVRTSSMTKVEANQSSTGMMSGSHFPDRWESLSTSALSGQASQPALPSLRMTTLRPNLSLILLTLFTPADQTWSSLANIFYSGYQPNFLVLRGNGIPNILFVVHAETVELGQNLHSLGHIPFSSSRDSFYKE